MVKTRRESEDHRMKGQSSERVGSRQPVTDGVGTSSDRLSKRIRK